jgi:hypothetical protein
MRKENPSIVKSSYKPAPPPPVLEMRKENPSIVKSSYKARTRTKYFYSRARFF